MKFSQLVLPAVLVLGACDNTGNDYLVGTLERDRITLAAERAEPVVAIHVHEGDTVQTGELLLELDPARAEAERAQLQARADQASRRVDELVRGPRRETIDEARSRLAAIESEMENADRERRRTAQLANENLASDSARDAAETAYRRLAAERDAGKAALETLLEGTTIEELDQARAQYNAATAALRAQEILIERLNVKAPGEARIEALPYKKGSQPSQGASVAILLANGAPYARVHVPVSLREKFAEHADVNVRLPDGKSFAARVRWVSGTAAFTPYYALTEHDRDHLSYAAEIELLDPQAADLPSGLPVEVHAVATE